MQTIIVIETAIKLLGSLLELAKESPDESVDDLIKKMRTEAKRTPKLTRDGFKSEDDRIDAEIAEGRDP